MPEPTLLGVPLTKDFPAEIDSDLKKEIKRQKTELEGFSLTVTGIHILGEGAPPRFFITFPPEEPSFKIRSKLEANQYDVGQQMGDKMLKFYVTRRVTKGKGWEV